MTSLTSVLTTSSAFSSRVIITWHCFQAMTLGSEVTCVTTGQQPASKAPMHLPGDCAPGELRPQDVACVSQH